MSKKIQIPINNERSNLASLFYQFIERKNRSRKSNHESIYDEMSPDEIMWLMAQGYALDDYDDYDDYDNDIYSSYEDDSCQVFPPAKGKNKRSRSEEVYDNFWENYERNHKKKHKHKSNKHKARIIDINVPFNGEEIEDVDGDYVSVIYYYPDYSNKYDRLEFNSLKEFDTFCAEEGFVVPPDVASDIAYRPCSHTCLRPSAREEGIMEIMAYEDWATMMYEACDINELSQ